MKEILFRGFHLCENGDKTAYVDCKAIKGKWIYWNQFGELTEPLLDNCNMHSHVSKEDAIPSTFSQYIGLTDKYDVKIFEGDIVKGLYYGFGNSIRDYVFTIRWHKETASWRANYFEPKECEIIGTIWDNPDE